MSSLRDNAGFVITVKIRTPAPRNEIVMAFLNAVLTAGDQFLLHIHPREEDLPYSNSTSSIQLHTCG